MAKIVSLADVRAARRAAHSVYTESASIAALDGDDEDYVDPPETPDDIWRDVAQIETELRRLTAELAILRAWRNHRRQQLRQLRGAQA